MLKKTTIRYILLGISALLIASCSQYEKILKSTDYNLKYTKAFEYYNKKEFGRAINLFEQIVNVFKATSKGDSVMFFMAKSYFGEDDYLMAGHYFKETTDNYSRSKFAVESDYMIGYCYYLTSPRPNLDQESTNLSILAFQKFIYKYPDSKYVPECKRLIAEMHDKLVEKAYLNAKLYFNMGTTNPLYFKSAIITLRNCILEYPDSKYREELMYMILESNYQLAENSVPEKRMERYQSTLDEYYSFVGEYPQSKFIPDAEKIHKSTKSILGL
jgi:outer membrane protein assembly factor BamD